MLESPRSVQPPPWGTEQTAFRALTSVAVVRARALLLFCVGIGIGVPALASAQTPIPFSETVVFFDEMQRATYTLDLGTLPNRPRLDIAVEHLGGDPNMIIEIKINGFGNQFVTCPNACPGPTTEIVSDYLPGPKNLSWSSIGIDPRVGYLDGKTIDVEVRVEDFGSSPAPQTLRIAFGGVTIVPWETNLIAYAPTFAQQSRTFFPTKDTTIYESAPNGSNGEGDFLWAGQDRVDLGGGTGGVDSFDLRSLVAFDLSPEIPVSATIDDADLDLWVDNTIGLVTSVSLRRVAEDVGSPSLTWAPGDAVAPGNEFTAGLSSISSATWDDRLSPTLPWGVPGGDPAVTLLETRNVSSTGPMSFDTPALTQAVQDMVSTGADEDGFVISGVPFSTLSDGGVAFRSSDFGPGAPNLVVLWTPTEPYQEGLEFTGAVSFISEGENLRWIYDLDQDDILETDIGGICTITQDDPPGQLLPYSYQFTGDPGFTGLDCCTWQLTANTGSNSTGTIGTGQAIFFHNLAPIEANLPPDTDGDGIRDNCDNCLTVPNGPLLGSCISGTAIGSLCQSDLECAGAGTCSLSQEDADGNFQGDACPEPGLTAMLAAGVLGLVSARRRA